MAQLRRMTSDEEDQLGFSVPANCSICSTDEGHVCGGCGRVILHQQGSTCPECWRQFWEEVG